MSSIVEQVLGVMAEQDRINAEIRANKLAIGEAQVGGDRAAENAAWQRDDDLLDALAGVNKKLAALLPQMTTEEKDAVKSARATK